MFRLKGFCYKLISMTTVIFANCLDLEWPVAGTLSLEAPLKTDDFNIEQDKKRELQIDTNDENVSILIAVNGLNATMTRLNRKL